MEEYEGYKREEKEPTIKKGYEPSERKDAAERKMVPMDYAQQIIFQEGPLKEVGVNGAQVDDVLAVCLEKLQGFNTNFACTENTYAIQHLKETLFWLRERRENREKRGVEGFNRL
jgi:hypothetical protein